MKALKISSIKEKREKDKSQELLINELINKINNLESELNNLKNKES